MTMIVVGGQSRKAGKTSIAAGLIRSLNRYAWTAVKLSSHWHEEVPSDDICSIREELDPLAMSDSSRFLAAGAARSYWIRIRPGEMQQAMPRLMPYLSGPHVIIESNGIVQHIRPDLYIMVFHYDVEEVKSSARDTVDRAGAIVAAGDSSLSPVWKDFLAEKRPGIPFFSTPDPGIIPIGLVDLVRRCIR